MPTQDYLHPTFLSHLSVDKACHQRADLDPPPHKTPLDKQDDEDEEEDDQVVMMYVAVVEMIGSKCNRFASQDCKWETLVRVPTPIYLWSLFNFNLFHNLFENKEKKTQLVTSK
jgi:hypothetical protein